MAIGTHGGVEVQGLKELGEALRALPDRAARNAARGSTAAAASVIRAEAKVRAPKFTGPVSAGHPPPGTLKRSLIMKRVGERSSILQQVYAVTVRKGKKYQKQGKSGNLSQDAFYWVFVEFGTVNMAAKPFLRPAFEAKKVAAVQAFEQYLGPRLAAEADKLKAFGIQRALG